MRSSRTGTGVGALWVVLLAGALALAGWTAPALAVEHELTAYGVKMSVDAQWPGVAGYRPVRIEFTPVKPFASDRQFEIELLAYQWDEGRDGIVVRQVVDLPALAPNVKVMLDVPFSGLQSYRLRIIEDGVLLSKLELRANATYRASDNMPRIMFLATDQSDAQFSDGQMQVVTGNPSANPNTGLPMTGPGMPGMPPGVPQPMIAPAPAPGPQPVNTVTIQRVVQRLPLAEFPVRWIEYTGLDVVSVSQAELLELAAQRRPQFQALMEWTRAGGNLWVTGVGQNWERLASVEQTLGFVVPEDGRDTNDPLKRGWKPPATLSFSPNSNYGVYGYMEDVAIAQPMPGQPPQNEAVRQEILEVLRKVEDEAKTGANLDQIALKLGVGKETLERWQREYGKPAEPAKQPKLALAIRPLDFGQVTVMTRTSPFNTNGWMIETLGSGADRLMWDQRMGLLPTGQTQGFWDFLIPGVGLAPVGAFQILITLFVVIIGPLNYFVWSRYRRLQMLIVTTPVCAIVVTGGLFLYALVNDGLGVRVRARSFTVLDQRVGQASNWSRLSYYAGLMPRDGMSFGVDTAVYPLRDYGYDMDELRQSPLMVWEDRLARASGLTAPPTGSQAPQPTHQHLASGWLNPRTPTQYLTQRSRPSKLGLEVKPSEDGQRLTVVNRLGVPIEYLLLSTDGEKYYLLKDLAAEAKGEAPLTDLNAAATDYRMLFHAETPTAPAEVDTSYYGRMNWRRARRMIWSGNPGMAPSFTSGRLERMLAETSAPGSALEPQTYLAILERSPETDAGVAGAVEESSFHVLLGRW